MVSFATGTKYYVAVTLTNSQSGSVASGTQVKVIVNSSSYSSYEDTTLKNCNWQDGAGNILYSWLESGETNSSTSSVYWIKLNSSIAGSGGTLTIYFCFYASGTNNFSSSGTTGAEPKFTGTYGQYDNGANIFTFYDNFAGSSLNGTNW